MQSIYTYFSGGSARKSERRIIFNNKTYSGCKNNFPQADIHPTVARDKMAVVSFTIFQLNQLMDEWE